MQTNLRTMRMLIAATAGWSTLFVADIACGDIVRLNEGQSLAGRIVEETAAEVRIRTGSSQGPRELILKMDKIAAIHRTLEEAAEIAKCNDRAALVQWSEGYFHADTPVLAVQCIERAVLLDPELKSKHCAGGTAEYQLFWNKQIFRIRSTNLDETDGGKPWLDLAKWADAAELKADARESLRRAGFLDRSLDEVRSLAKSWNVALDPWVSPHLTMALETGLFLKVIHDEQADVEAKPGFEFFLLPIYYESDGSRRVLSRLILAKKDRGGFYGIMAMHRQPSGEAIQAMGDAPVYERMELRSTAEGAPQVVWKNNLSPRVHEGETYKQEPVRTKPESQRPDGWAIVILELESSVQSIRLEWGDGSSDLIDLSFVRAAREALAEPERRMPGSPEVIRAINHVRQSSPALAEMALTQLAMIRQRVIGERSDEWSRSVDPVVIEAANRGENRIDSAGWRYFAMQPALLKSTSVLFESASTVMKHRWIEIISRFGASPGMSNTETAKGILLSMMRTGPLDVCQQCLNAMALLHIEIDWNQVSGASKNAQLAALSRLTLLRREDAVSALLTIMKSVRRSSADEIAKYVRSLNLKLEDPRDPLLKKWPELKSDSDRLSLVTVLRPADLGDLVYSQPFSGILRLGLSSKKAGSQFQNDVFELTIEQLIRHESTSDALAHGQFPLLVRLRVNDPILLALLECARNGTGAQRRSAIGLMLEMGLSANVVAALESMTDEGNDLNEILAELLSRSVAVAPDGVASLCGRLLTPDHAESAEIVLRELNRMAASIPAANQWRLRAALRAGVDMESLAELTSTLKPALAVSATRWLHQLGHFSLQDGQVFAAAQGGNSMRAVLEELDFRRAQFVDGEYGVVAVVEYCDAVRYSLHASMEGRIPPLWRWSTPRRRTIVMHPLALQSAESGNVYSVRFNETTIGFGRSRQSVRPIRKPDGFLPALADAPDACLAATGWGWPAPMTIAGFADESATGPSILPGNRPAVENPGEDLMTINVTAQLAAALLEGGLMKPEDLKEFSDAPIKMTLRYSGFGSYVGIAPTRLLPTSPKSGQRHVLSVMIFLEKLN